MSKIQFTSLFAILVLAFSYSTAKADPPIAVFELDGDSAYTTACTSTFPSLTPIGCKDDWDLLNGTQIPGDPNQNGSAGGSLARSFISGSASIAVFTTGGSKDPNDVSSWKWKNGGTPDKDAITNGYAAAYKSPSPNGHFILLFGADRFAVNGDANIGFWFFQQDVHPVGATGGGFSNAHSKNDLLIVSAFTQGGGVSTITVYAWDPACTKGVNNPDPGQCAEKNLKLVYASTPSATCANGNAGCSIVNPTGTTVSWPYLTKFGNNDTTIPEGGFYEGGLDITDMFELLGEGDTPLPCFSSFLIETRTSQSPSAVLKDFVSGSFSICGMNTTKACAGDGVLNNVGTAIHYKYTGTVTNTGIGTLNHTTIVDSLPTGSSNVVFKKGTPAVPPAIPGEPTTTVSSAACPAAPAYPTGTTCADIGALDPGAVVKWAVEFDSTSTSVQNNASARAASAPDSSPGACSAGRYDLQHRQ